MKNLNEILMKNDSFIALKRDIKIMRLKSKYFDLISEIVNSSVDEALLNGYDNIDSPFYPRYLVFRNLLVDYIEPCIFDVLQLDDKNNRG